MLKKSIFPSLLVVLALILATVFLGLRPATPAHAAALKIMALGDSITGSPGCWRAILWNKLNTAGYTNFTPVGTLPPAGCPQGSDGNNEGHGGYLATNIASQNQLPPWLSATNPDIVIMHLGTNDVWSSISNDALLAAFTTLVNQMRANNPNMKIVVAQIIQLNPSGCTECNNRAASFNAAIPAWAQGMSTAQSPIYVVDQWTGFNTTTDTNGDGVHPNDVGFQKMADKFYPVVAALVSGGTIPTATRVPPTITPTSIPSNLVSYNKPVTTSSVESANGGTNVGANAVDGNMNTRWASQYADPQWLYVDLGSATAITTVDIVWEPAYAVQYKLQISNDASTWTDVYTTTSGDGGTDTISVNQTARYVRVYGTQRVNSSWGYSIWEFRVWAGSVGPTNTASPTLSASPTRTFTPLAPTLTPTRTNTPNSFTPTRTNTPNNFTPTRTNTPNSFTPTRTNTPLAATATPTSGGGGTCTPVTSTITAPFTFDGAGTFCWQSSNLGTYINSWNTVSVTLNGTNVTNLYLASGSYPAKIGGFWYVAYNSSVAWGHFEAK